MRIFSRRNLEQIELLHTAIHVLVVCEGADVKQTIYYVISERVKAQSQRAS